MPNRLNQVFTNWKYKNWKDLVHGNTINAVLLKQLKLFNFKEGKDIITFAYWLEELNKSRG